MPDRTQMSSMSSPIPEGSSEVGDGRWNCEELSLMTAELSYLQDRRPAFENLGKRMGIPGIKAVARLSSRRSATVRPLVRRCA
jgi:hypothetical protein